MARLSLNEHQRRIIQLSHEWNVTLPPVPTRLERPQSLPSYRVPADDQKAEDLLHRHALEVHRPRSGLTRAFSTNNLRKGKNWEPRHVIDVLMAWISQSGSAGVAEALILKLAASGADLSAMQVQKSGLLSRRKSLEGLVDRTKMLKQAVQHGQLELVHVLIPYADPLSLDACLPVAIRQGNTPITELLLRFGANVSQTPEGQDAFRQACSVPGLHDLVRLIVHSDGPPSATLASQCLVDATGIGSLENVLHLSRSVADGDYNHAEALRIAVERGRGDLAVAIVMGNKPPRDPGVSQAFGIVCTSQSLPPAAKLRISELLLCAGARGDVLSQALQTACDAQFYEMASLLSAYGVSIEYDNASVVKSAIRQGQLDLVCSLLNETSTLRPPLASSCVSAIPPQIPEADRYVLLTLLLGKGANGLPLDEMLIIAAESGDIASVELLVTPYFPGTPLSGGPADPKAIQRRQVSPQKKANAGSRQGLRHEVASPDHKEGAALRAAVLCADIEMTRAILSAKPSPKILSAIFPLTRSLASEERYRIIMLFLEGTLSGPSLHMALQDALTETARDDNLIDLLLLHKADINFNDGVGLREVILQGDIRLLEKLIPKASPQTMSARIVDVMSLADHRMRHDMMSLLLNAGAAVGAEEVSAALLATLCETPVDMSLLRLLLQKGAADINNPKFPAPLRAVRNPDPKVLDLVLDLGNPSPPTIAKALADIVALPPTDGKMWKLKSALGKSTRKIQGLGSLLATEVQSLVQQDPKRQLPALPTLSLLLDHGADPNDCQAASLCYAVSAANMQICDLLLQCQRPPSAVSIGLSLPHALKITDHMDRMSFTKKLITAGAPPQEVNRGLVHAITHFTDDIFLIDVLASAADTSDGDALSLAVSKESARIVELLLSKSKNGQESKNSCLQRAMGVRDRAVRRQICSSLLKDGVSAEAASGALLIAARDGDLELGDILMTYGANISSNGGQAIIEACRGGSSEVLEVLLRAGGHPSKKTLERGFQAATEVRDLNKRAVIFEKLLKRGVVGEPVDAQLTSAARYGEQGQEVLRVLLASGADPNHNGGEAVVAATRSAFIGNLELLLGLWDEEGRQRKPSHPTLLRALKSSWSLSRDTRLHVVENLFKAGMPASGDVHMILNEAVNEEAPDERLIKLLLDNGASPTANDCKTLVDAAKRGAASSSSSPTLGVLLEGQLSDGAIDKAFSQCFQAGNFHEWFSEAGLSTIELLLNKGAQGSPLSELLALVMRGSTVGDDDSARSLTDRFFDTIVSHGPDVNHNSGDVLQIAASQANVAWTNSLLACHPSTESLSYAFQHIFDTHLDQDAALELFEMFSGYRDGETCVDVMMQKHGIEPVLVRAMSQYPRSLKILETLLDAGFYHDQATFCRLHADIDEDEEVTLLTWAIAEPQKKISSSLIQLLIERGAKVNVSTRLSQTTPLMLAVQNRRPDVVEMLLLEGADVDVTDFLNRSPLSMATNIGGELAIEMTRLILAADPARDDGSLHNAARELNLAAVKALVQAGHDADFPSPQHDGRSALGEMCLKGSERGELTADGEKAMQKLATYLIDNGSDLSIRSGNRPMLHLCFEAGDPIATTRVFLKAGMWKHVNEPMNLYTDGTLTYSPTMYVKKILPGSDFKDDILKLLYANRATDVFYANEGQQPRDAVGLPEDIKASERVRKARLERMAEESEDFTLAMARKKEQANVDAYIWRQQAEMEDIRRRKVQNEDLEAIRNRARLEESLESKAHQRRISEQRALTESSTSRVRAIAAAELENENVRQRKMLEWEGQANRERVENARTVSAIRVSEREEIDRLERIAEDRMTKRLDAQRKVIESQERLARRIASGPGGANQQRQLGYVTELN